MTSSQTAAAVLGLPALRPGWPVSRETQSTVASLGQSWDVIDQSLGIVTASAAAAAVAVTAVAVAVVAAAMGAAAVAVVVAAVAMVAAAVAGASMTGPFEEVSLEQTAVEMYTSMCQHVHGDTR